MKQTAPMNPHRFSILPGDWAVARLAPDVPLPAWATAPVPFLSVTRTAAELSIVAPASAVPAAVRAGFGWSLLPLHGPIAFDQTGVLASFAVPLSKAGIAIFALSTFDADYLLAKTARVDEAVSALLAAGHIQN
jgi:hypothetical protein